MNSTIAAPHVPVAPKILYFGTPVVVGLGRGGQSLENLEGAAGLTPVPAEHVRPSRVLECPLQIEGRVVAIHPLGGPDGLACAVEVEALQMYADPGIVLGPNHVDPTAWSPLIYNFRHYFGLGTELGRTFRADTPR